MSGSAERFSAFWNSRQPRERAFLIALAASAALALLLQLLWVSHQARATLKQQLPHLRQQLESVQQKASELQRLKTQPPNPLPAHGNALLAATSASTRASALPEAATQLQLEGPGRVRLRATLPFDRWLAWIAALQSEARLRLISCRVEAAGAAGLVRIDALFSLPESG